MEHPVRTNLWLLQVIVAGASGDMDVEGTYEFVVATDTAEDAMKLVTVEVSNTRILRAVTHGLSSCAIREPCVVGWALIKRTRTGVLRDE